MYAKIINSNSKINFVMMRKPILKRKYALISYPSDLESTGHIMKKVKISTLQTVAQDFIKPEPDLEEFQLLEDFPSVFKCADALFEFLQGDISHPPPDLCQPDQLLSLANIFLSPNPLQEGRFPRTHPASPDLVDINVTSKMKEALDDLLKCRDVEISLRGPRGWGKLYLLALYILVSRQNKQNRVLYVNNPEACSEKLHQYVANEFVYCCFPDRDIPDFPPPPGSELIGAPKLEQWYEFLSNTDTEAVTISKAFARLSKWYRKKKILFIFALDQLNVVHRYKTSFHDSHFADNFRTIFSRENCAKKIISASDNNEDFDTQRQGCQKYIHKLFDKNDVILLLYGLLSHKIMPEDRAKILAELRNSVQAQPSEEEEKIEEVAKEYSVLIRGFKLKFPFIPDPSQSENFAIQKDWEKDSEYDTLHSIIQTIGDSPYELSLLVEFLVSSNLSSIEEILEDFFEKRMLEYNHMHTKYRKDQNFMIGSDAFASLCQVIIAVDSDKAFKEFGFYDRNLIYALREGNQFKYYSISSAAAKALEIYYSTDLLYQDYTIKGGI